MNITKLLLTFFFSSCLLPAEERYEGMAANIPQAIKSENIVEICYFRHIYIAPPVGKFRNGEHIRSGVITKVIKGPLKVGTRIDRINYDDTFKHKSGFNKIVEGRIEVIFLEKDDLEINKNGLIKTIGTIFNFDRVAGDKHSIECLRVLKIELAKAKLPAK